MNPGMNQVLIFIILAAIVYFLIDRIDVSSGPRVDGRQVMVETRDLEVHFTRGATFSEAFMIFGGSNAQLRNNVSDALLSTLAMRHASLIHQRYPDFHLCKSPGAAQAKRYIEAMNFIGTTRSARRAIQEAVDVHAERVRGGGERTCISISGAALSFDSVSLKEDGRDVTGDFGQALRMNPYYLAEEAELVSCAALLR
jgi:hypothetical protein